MLDYIEKLLIEFLKAFGSAVWSFFTEFYSWVFEKFISQIEAVLQTAGLDASFGWAVEFWETLNFFFPINEGLAILTIVFTYWSACFIIKVVLKAVPTVY